MSVRPVTRIYTQMCALVLDSTAHEILARPPGLYSMKTLKKAGAEQLDWQLVVATVKHNKFLDENRIILPIYNEYGMSQNLKCISSLHFSTFLELW